MDFAWGAFFRKLRFFLLYDPAPYIYIYIYISITGCSGEDAPPRALYILMYVVLLVFHAEIKGRRIWPYAKILPYTSTLYSTLIQHELTYKVPYKVMCIRLRIRFMGGSWAVSCFRGLFTGCDFGSCFDLAFV